MDPAYKEYSKTANLHIQSMCQVPVGILPRIKQKKNKSENLLNSFRS